ncbi:MAG: flagellar basal body-associated protein FliL, partial [Octadecabacter sp.]
EVEAGGQEAVFSHEPRLRDAFLQVMFDHANIGGFNGVFTASSNMRILREALQDAADQVMRGHITDVLIVDIVRQDVTN